MWKCIKCGTEGNDDGTPCMTCDNVIVPETLMIVVDPRGSVVKAEVLSFDEPPEYLPKPRWFDLFRARRLDSDLAAGKGIPVVTGATLTSRAVAAAVRRALALHAVLVAAGAEPPR